MVTEKQFELLLSQLHKSDTENALLHELLVNALLERDNLDHAMSRRLWYMEAIEIELIHLRYEELLGSDDDG